MPEASSELSTTGVSTKSGSAQAVRSIGVRVEPKKIHLAIVSGSIEHPTLEASETIPAPKGWSEAQALQWYRNQVGMWIEQHKPVRAFVRDSESGPQRNVQSLQSRCRIEGVIIEIAHAKGLRVGGGRLTSISSKLDTKRAKKYVGHEEFRGIDLGKCNALLREAILAAVAGLGIP